MPQTRLNRVDVARAGTCQGLFGNHDCLDKRDDDDDERTTQGAAAASARGGDEWRKKGGNEGRKEGGKIKLGGENKSKQDTDRSLVLRYLKRWAKRWKCFAKQQPGRARLKGPAFMPISVVSYLFR